MYVHAIRILLGTRPNYNVSGVAIFIHMLPHSRLTQDKYAIVRSNSLGAQPIINAWFSATVCHTQLALLQILMILALARISSLGVLKLISVSSNVLKLETPCKLWLQPMMSVAAKKDMGGLLRRNNACFFVRTFIILMGWRKILKMNVTV